MPIKIAFSDIVHTMILIDEAHRWINAKKPPHPGSDHRICQGGTKILRRDPSCHSIDRDLIPEGSTNENIDKLKTIFEFSQYKILFGKIQNILPLIRSSLPE